MATFDYTMMSHDRSPADTLRVLGHPDDVLNHPDMTTAEKREVLAAWASDAHGVIDSPHLRQIDSGAIVSVDEVLRALRALDEPSADRTATGQTPRAGRHRRPSLPRILVSLVRRDDDDDPPPTPAAAALPLEVAVARRRKWEPTDGAELVAA